MACAGENGIRLVTVLMLVVGLFSACVKEPPTLSVMTETQSPRSAEAEHSVSALERIQNAGVLVVGTAITEPFEYYDPVTGELIGFDVDIARRIAQELGVELQWVEMPFANLIPALQEHKVDMTIAAMYINPEREALVDFAEAYIHTGLVMAAEAETARQVTGTDDLAGLRVGVKIGSTGAQLAKTLAENGIDITIEEYKDTLDSLLDLEVGRVDVVFNDYLNTLVYLKQAGSDLEIIRDAAGEPLFQSWVGLGIAVPQGDSELLAVIDQTLAEMNADGTLDELKNRWLSSEIQ